MTPSPAPVMEPVEPIIKLLSVGIAFFAVCLFLSEVFFKDDSQLFQVFAQLLSGFGGAFLMRVTGKKNGPVAGNAQPPAAVEEHA